MPRLSGSEWTEERMARMDRHGREAFASCLEILGDHPAQLRVFRQVLELSNSGRHHTEKAQHDLLSILVAMVIPDEKADDEKLLDDMRRIMAHAMLGYSLLKHEEGG